MPRRHGLSQHRPCLLSTTASASSRCRKRPVTGASQLATWSKSDQLAVSVVGPLNEVGVASFGRISNVDDRCFAWCFVAGLNNHCDPITNSCVHVFPFSHERVVLCAPHSMVCDPWTNLKVIRHVEVIHSVKVITVRAESAEKNWTICPF